MKKNRIIWACLWILSLVGISFYGGIISYGFCIVLTLVPIVSLLYLVYVYYFFHMYQKVDKKWLVADQKYPFYFTLVNDYYFLFSGIRVKFFSDFSEIIGLSEDIEYEFVPKSGYTEQTNLICHYRGEYYVGIQTVVIQDFFRMFCFSYKNPEPLKVLVRPKLVYLEEQKSVDMNSVSREANVGGSEPDVLVRDYVYGDDIRQVHWGASAKSGKLMVRKKIGTKQSGVGILFCTQRFGSDIHTYLVAENKMLETELALALLSVGKGVPVIHFHREAGMKMFDVSGMDKFDAYYDFVSDIRFDSSYTDDIFYMEAVQSPLLVSCKTVLLITQGYSNGMGNLLEILSRNNVNVIVYVIAKAMPEELLAAGFSNLKTVQIRPEDDLMEVL